MKGRCLGGGFELALACDDIIAEEQRHLSFPANRGMVGKAAAKVEQCVTMKQSVDVDVWVRGTERAAAHTISDLPARADEWTDADVRRLLSEMLLALEREKNPNGEPPPVTLRGFSWIVNGYDRGGVLVHIDMQMGSASAGPLNVPQRTLSAMIQRVMRPTGSSSAIH